MSEADRPDVDEYTADALEHIARVRDFLGQFSAELTTRGIRHDASKLDPEEMTIFEPVRARLRELSYGSEEHKSAMAEIAHGIRRHHAINSHHPEHYPDGVAGMNLLDLVEMFCDWRAACERSKGGDFRKSVEINIARFQIDAQLASILRNTIAFMKP